MSLTKHYVWQFYLLQKVQGGVDELCLHQECPPDSGLPHSLRASQVYQVELCLPDEVRPRLPGTDVDGEDTVGTSGRHVHGGLKVKVSCQNFDNFTSQR